MGDNDRNNAGTLWWKLRSLWRGEYGLPSDEHIRADVGLPLRGMLHDRCPISPFARAWLR